MSNRRSPQSTSLSRLLPDRFLRGGVVRSRAPHGEVNLSARLEFALKKTLFDPLDDEELALLDDFLLERTDADTSDEIAAADGDEGIIGVSELDGFLTAIVSGPNAIGASTWLPMIGGDDEPTWASTDQFQEIVELMIRHQNSIAETLLQDPDAFEPMFEERDVDGRTNLIVDEWCYGYLRGVALDLDAWNAGGKDIEDHLRPIRLSGTEEGWDLLEQMNEMEREGVRSAIPQSVRALHKYWLERRSQRSEPMRRAAPKVGRNDPCPCGSGRKYKQCCLQ